MKQNLRLLMAIREKGMRQKDFANAVGDHHTFISQVINGWRNLDRGRKEKYAAALGCKIEDIFQE